MNGHASRRQISAALVAGGLLLVTLPDRCVSDEKSSELADWLRQVDTNVLSDEEQSLGIAPADLPKMLSTSIRERRRAANLRDVDTWRKLKSKADWETFRDARIQALRESLGTFPEPPKDLNIRVTRTLKGDGFEIDCIVFESRPGLHVTANLYRPAKPAGSMPGILICHSHHNPKTQSELQDMGMTWARAGCVVLVMDQLGHGERRQHPFRSSKDFPKSFRVSRQDYYFRYNVGIQLHLIGDSLIGWMAWDLMRGVDLLLGHPGVDSRRIILLGAVAGGGDPAAVTAAIDRRIAAAVPFNFGGPQPETTFPLPKDAELQFNYIGGGSWESTRNLQSSVRGGFLPWVIVGATAPRRLIYAHEFKWDKENDPVWRRLQQLYEWYDVAGNLSSLKGYGMVSLSSKEASHCNNIGAHHRKGIHPPFEQWFGIPQPDPEHRDRREWSELFCVEGVDLAESIELTPAHQLAYRIAQERIAAVREQLKDTPADMRREVLINAWLKKLIGRWEIQAGGLEPAAKREGRIQIVRWVQGTDKGIVCPVVALFPAKTPKTGCPLVIGVCQSGKDAMLKARAAEIGKLIESGIAVALVDLRGCGETRPGRYRGRRSYATGLSSGELMLGKTLVGQRLKDLVIIAHSIRHHTLVDETKIAVWGDSLAKTNGPDVRIAVPLGIDEEPAHSEPLGPTLALLLPLLIDDVKAVWARGGLVSIRSVLDSQFVHVPHDYVVPGILEAGDLPDLAAALAPTPVFVSDPVDGTNRPAGEELINSEWAVARKAHGTSHSLQFGAASNAAAWLIRQLGGK